MRARFPGDMHVLFDLVPFSRPTTAVAAEVSASLRLLSCLRALGTFSRNGGYGGGLVHTLVIF